MANIFDNPPSGYDRSKSKGWLVPSRTPQRKTVDKIKQENDELKQRLEQLEVIVGELASKKGKK